MLIQDLKFAVRTLTSRPAFAATAVLTLALGLGVNAAMFSVIRAVLLRPLPYSEPHELVRLTGLNRATGQRDNLSPADFLDLAREAGSFARAGAHGWIGFFTVTDGAGDTERLGGVNVTEGFFPTLGAGFAAGRTFTPEEDSPGGPRVVILSHTFWQRRYAGDPGVIGRPMTINARPATIVGVLDARFRHIEQNPERAPDVFMPYQFEAGANRGGHFIRAIGRLRPGASVDSARAELVAIAARLEEQYPVDNTNHGVAVQPLHDAIVESARPALLMLGAAVAFVLLVACANLANLLLAHGATRRTELAIRAAMGAGRWRLIRQMLTESVVLAAAGSVVGLGLASWAMGVLTTLGSADVPRAQDIRLDGTVLLFMSLLTTVAGVLTGLLPALQLSAGEVHAAVREGLRGQARAVHRRAREALIASQVALALVLLVGAGLLLRSLWSLQQVDTGFAVEQVLTFDTALPTATYEEGDQIPFYERFYDRIRELPGVQSVGAINIMPLSANYDGRGVQIEASPKPPGQGESAQARSISPEYFHAMGIPLIRGRAFTNADREGTPRVVIVSASMARRYWPGTDPIGQRITFNAGIPPDEQQDVGGPGSREVVGVAGDVKHLGLDEREVPMFYTPQAQQPSYHTMSLVVRAAGDPAALTTAIRGELTKMDRGVPLYRVRTLETVLRASVAQPRMRAWLLGLFAALALALAALGVYGVVGYLVSQRTQEIGIRLALGAARGRVLAWMLLEGLRPVAIGVAIGLAAAFGTGQLLQRMLFGVTPTDLPAYVAAAGLLVVAAVAAIWLPARRATRIDPAVALRSS